MERNEATPPVIPGKKNEFSEDIRAITNEAPNNEQTTSYGAVEGTPHEEPKGLKSKLMNNQFFVTKGKAFAFAKSKRFWVAFMLGQILSLMITATNTFTTLIAEDANIPAFQTLLNYCLLTIIYTPYSIYRMGFKEYFRMVRCHGWKFLIMGFVDVQGNYFVVLAYQYTNMLSASLLDSWATVAVVILSFIFLKVRYHWTQISGIVICLGGLALLVVSDLKTNKNYEASNPALGDGFMILGATFYGISNVLEEFFVTKQPLYVVVGQLSFWASLINLAQAFIFNRNQMLHINWTPKMGGYLTGFTLAMFILYTLVPIMFRISSATFYNISILTSDFWSLIVGLRVFHYYVYWLYPIAFVCVLFGLCVYHIFVDATKDAKKPWLREGEGVDGVGMYRGSISEASASLPDDSLSKVTSATVGERTLNETEIAELQVERKP
ncbi:membrane transporter [Schizosaccharomyces japonicus yFS275]|uniref:Membrane transporter n=1 Tax=Schizosaccharomyces japonicus (strain yFS275 / FY16936) TaxID=402676 RepID=B6JZ20_SCHJY|nr:membrane transporter [Schizosaccharomyces japonicus yFS275]EEB06788.1 membrane transporter [Schizosaccharomyces japonicus yFS275]